VTEDEEAAREKRNRELREDYERRLDPKPEPERPPDEQEGEESLNEAVERRMREHQEET
jgi:hypothetical protein